MYWRENRLDSTSSTRRQGISKSTISIVQDHTAGALAMFTSRRAEGYRKEPRQHYYGSGNDDSHASRRMPVREHHPAQSLTEARPRPSEPRNLPRTSTSHQTRPASRKEPRLQNEYPPRVVPQNSTSKARAPESKHHLRSKRKPSPARRPPPVRRVSTFTIEHKPEKVVDRHMRRAQSDYIERRPHAPVEKNPRPVRHVHWA
jgi:hypothetical protein